MLWTVIGLGRVGGWAGSGYGFAIHSMTWEYRQGSASSQQPEQRSARRAVIRAVSFKGVTLVHWWVTGWVTQRGVSQTGGAAAYLLGPERVVGGGRRLPDKQRQDGEAHHSAAPSRRRRTAKRPRRHRGLLAASRRRRARCQMHAGSGRRARTACLARCLRVTLSHLRAAAGRSWQVPAAVETGVGDRPGRGDAKHPAAAQIPTGQRLSFSQDNVA